jgi:small subunit ribosomal protein S16
VAVVLRLARLGKHKSPVYRIVAADKQAKRDGRFLQVVGTYNTLNNPARITIKEDVVKKWMEQGAKPTDVVRSIIRRAMPGYVEGREEHQRTKIQAARKARKARAAKSAKSSKK